MRHRPKRGQNRVECPVTGIIAPSGEFRQRWDGVYVHKSALDPRHPQEDIRSIPETAIPTIRFKTTELDIDYTGIDYMQISRTFMVCPYDKETQPIEWELWLNTTYTDAIVAKTRGE